MKKDELKEFLKFYINQRGELTVDEIIDKYINEYEEKTCLTCLHFNVFADEEPCINCEDDNFKWELKN